MSRRVQVIGAHSADFVWRAGGAVAVAVAARRRRPRSSRCPTASAASRASCGSRRARPSRTSRASATTRPRPRPTALGATFRCLDLGDYPLQIDADALVAASPTSIRAFAPDVLITHTDTRPVQPRPPGRLRRGRSRPRPGRRRRGAERVRHDRAAGPVPVRAPSARAVQLHPDDLRRHHAGLRAQAGGDGRDEGAELPADLLRPARRAARQPRAARVGRTRPCATPRPSSA